MSENSKTFTSVNNIQYTVYILNIKLQQIDII